MHLMRTITSIVAAALFAGMALSASAATIENKGFAEGYNVVSIAGEIEIGDADKFERVIAPLDGPAVVFLNSPGGALVDGLNIGISIRRHGYHTAVVSDLCASVCGLIWLAGASRFVAPESKIGFHAAYNKDDGTETGEGNALVGAYLSNLGLSYDAIAYLTDAAPHDMHWLTPRAAAKIGITYSLVSPPAASEPQPFMPQQPAAPTPAPPPPPARSTAEQEARLFVLRYNAYWSQGGVNVEGLAAYYAPTISFYGTMTSREKVMDAKRKFSARWPERHYTVNQDSLFVQCDGNVCSVTGVVAWDCTSQERGAHAAGSANFALRIADGQIISENGSVLTNHADTVANGQPQASTTAAFQQGYTDRVAWEAWFAATSGEFHQGAYFWSGQRSLPQPQPCASLSGNYAAGCFAAQSRLSVSDVRRKTEPDYRAGWNSYTDQ